MGRWFGRVSDNTVLTARDVRLPTVYIDEILRQVTRTFEKVAENLQALKAERTPERWGQDETGDGKRKRSYGFKWTNRHLMIERDGAECITMALNGRIGI
ncbi:hypothetical protein V498_09785 [Pseudogymnoascus sp. VKM F-4517 (FW-2822)]|nr:hypothetical protein V498_09785 [Pseudogymnoascus sp. VKM F-4517 (FW-2822)]